MTIVLMADHTPQNDPETGLISSLIPVFVQAA